MTLPGWEFYGLKFDWLMLLLVTFVPFVIVFFTTRTEHEEKHTDLTAGDEGEEWNATLAR